VAWYLLKVANTEEKWEFWFFFTKAQDIWPLWEWNNCTLLSFLWKISLWQGRVEQTAKLQNSTRTLKFSSLQGNSQRSAMPFESSVVCRIPKHFSTSRKPNHKNAKFLIWKFKKMQKPWKYFLPTHHNWISGNI
jgi:hypothetical protein